MVKDGPSDMRQPGITGGEGINNLNALSTIRPPALWRELSPKGGGKNKQKWYPGTKESSMGTNRNLN